MIIDAHIHPFTSENNLVKWHCRELNNNFESVIADMKNAGIDMFCGSVIDKNHGTTEEILKRENDTALSLYEKYFDLYIPGVVIHPEHIQLSCEYIKKAYDSGVHLIGELTPYLHGFSTYSSCMEIFEYAQELEMTVNCHPTNNEDMSFVAKAFPKLNFIFAHPGEGRQLDEHIERMTKYDNVYLDLSGTGILRYHVIKSIVSKVGRERVLFGTDYPICNPAAYKAAVLYEKLTDEETECIFYKNAQRLLCL